MHSRHTPYPRTIVGPSKYHSGIMGTILKLSLTVHGMITLINLTALNKSPVSCNLEQSVDCHSGLVMACVHIRRIWNGTDSTGGDAAWIQWGAGDADLVGIVRGWSSDGFSMVLRLLTDCQVLSIDTTPYSLSYLNSPRTVLPMWPSNLQTDCRESTDSLLVKYWHMSASCKL